ncbi:unnamed protein product [Bursaphelenchus xylophilus]|uniref:(pine wood nematode) hypothetical protein n=1 Tax=Bursaphelenchus xylophilus TaxID=6326 RepID=A0A1I7RSJ7_BURXY|nr:unnamed protein product [Bursaphelenchus xylophilus]CAG9122896.1 unnamed protein product [Bursaphelenchus xylophilus]
MADYDDVNFEDDEPVPISEEIIQEDGQAQSSRDAEMVQLMEEECRESSVPKLEPQGDQTSLICEESMNIDKDLFSEEIPGLLAFERGRVFQSNLAAKRGHNRFRTELEPEDVKLVNEMGQLSADQLMDYMRKIKDQACCLGHAQAEQCKRAKFLKIFQS